MAITVSNVFSGGLNTTSSFTTPGLAFGANKLDIVTIFSNFVATGITTPTVTSPNRTWTQIATKTDAGTTWRVTLFRSMGSSVSGEVLTVSFGGQTQDHAKHVEDEISGTDTTGSNGAGAIVQSASNTQNSTNAGFTVNLAALGNANNLAYGAIANANTSAITPGTGYTATVNDTGLFTNSTEYKINDTAVGWTWASQSMVSTLVAIEVAAPAVANAARLRSLLGVGL